MSYINKKNKLNIARRIVTTASIATIMFSSVAPLMTSASTVTKPSYSQTDKKDFGTGQGIKWPDHVYAPFVDFTDWVPEDGYGGAPSLVNLAKNQGAKFYNLGFIKATGGVNEDGSLKWGFGGLGALSEGSDHGQYQGMKKSIKDLRDMGGDVTMSFGGATGTAFWMQTQDVDTLVKTYVNIIKGFNLTAIDLDIECAGQDVAQNKANGEAIKKVQELTGVDVILTLPAGPSGFYEKSYNKSLENFKSYYNAGVDIKFANLETMWFGSAATQGYAKAATDTVDSVAKQMQQIAKDKDGTEMTLEEAYGRIGTTPSIGYESYENPVFTTADMQVVIKHAIEKNIAQVSFWAANRDAKIGSYKDNSGITKPFEFGAIGRQFADKNNDGSKVGVTTDKVVDATTVTNE